MKQDLVLVVGATGFLGGKVVDALLARGKQVRALVRPSSDASRLKAKDVQIAPRGHDGPRLAGSGDARHRPRGHHRDRLPPAQQG